MLTFQRATRISGCASDVAMAAHIDLSLVESGIYYD